MTKDVISIEKVLNSRCSCDSIFPKRHWGLFTNKNPSKRVIRNILTCVTSPLSFESSNKKLSHWFENGCLVLGFKKPNNPSEERKLHIQSGIQQEAVYLACTAQGVGTCIQNQGINGTENKEEIITAKLPIREMTEPYDSGHFTTDVPGPKKPFISGKNLAKPVRDGDIDCLPQLKNLPSFNESGPPATKNDISQLLWAAKGRTPHLIRIHVWKYVWGLTIPTWGGGQTYTNVYLIKGNKLFRYINWTKNFSLLNRLFLNYAKWTRGNPTHDISFIKNINTRFNLNGTDAAIILSQNEKTGRSLWEIGYMLVNMFLQVKGLGIAFKSKLFNPEEMLELNMLGVNNAVAVVLL